MSYRIRWLVGLIVLLLLSFFPSPLARPVASAPLSPGGLGQLAFADTVDGQLEIFVIGADGRAQINLTQHPANDSFPTWSPDGRTIAFVSDRDHAPAPGSSIYLMNADGSNVRLWRANAWQPAWSPTGTTIAFVANEEIWSRIYVMKVDGTGLRAITPRSSSEPSWSPDGIRLVYVSTAVPERTDLYTVRLNGAENRLLLQGQPGEYPSSPQWSPDGVTIAVYGTLQDDATTYFVDVTNGRRQVLPNLYHNVYARGWSPDGQLLAVSYNSARDFHHVAMMDRTGAMTLPGGVGHLACKCISGAVWNPARGSSPLANLTFVPQLWLGTRTASGGRVQPTP